MLRYISNESKNFEERFLDAISDIPLYTDEWTDFNPSDPGITILEILTGFETLQQDRLLESSDQVTRNLLAMVGFRAMRGRGARLLIAAEKVNRSVVLPANHQFKIGDLIFETNRSISVEDTKLIAVYGRKADGVFSEYSYLMDRETQVPARVFGDRPEVGDALYLVANALPMARREAVFYITLRKRYNRNPLTERMKNTFAKLRWECYTSEGWEEIDVRDNTNALLMDGEIKVWIPEHAALCRETPQEGYCIRAVLERVDYDVYPRITGIDGFLFEVWQKHTYSECHSFGKAKSAHIFSGLRQEVYVNVFCREAKKTSYRKYEYSANPELTGRYYDRTDIAPGEFDIFFSKKQHGFGPERGRDCVRVLLYTDEVMRRYRIGRVLGYDNQALELPFAQIVSHSFCILAKRTLPDGSDIYDFVRPEKDTDGALYYHLLERDGRIIIEDAGEFIGAELFLGTVSVHSGSEGNIRGGNVLVSDSDDSGNVYYNPGAGTGGMFHETLSDVRERFLKDMDASYTAVTAADFEAVVKSTPGLCIHKAKAHMDDQKNLIMIAVKPGTDEQFPRLSEIYLKTITERLKERRLLTTRTEISQPVYTAVNVSGTVYVKLHYENSEHDIEEALKTRIDYLNTDKNFGDRLSFDEVFHTIEMLECVEYVYDLSVRPQSLVAAHMEDADICPDFNCLLYPGQIKIETINFEGGM